jgi:hypothetical protein
LEEIDGVVSVRSFELFIQWLYLGRVSFGKLSSEEAITAIIEFLTFADMCHSTGMEIDMVRQIKTILLGDPPPSNKESYSRDPDTNTHV